MKFSVQDIQQLVQTHYGLEAAAGPLPGEIDFNFKIKASDNQYFTLKIANPETTFEQLEFQHALMRQLREAQTGLEIPRPLQTLSGREIEILDGPDGKRRFLRMLRWIDGRCLAEVNPHSPFLLENIGEMCGKLSAALQGFDHPAAHRFLKWDPAQAAWTAAEIDRIPDAEKRELAQYFLQLFEKQAVPLFPQLRKSVAYCDANDYNVLVGGDHENPHAPGVIDFGDAVYTFTINDPAIAAAYAAMHKPDPLAAVFHIVKGYHRIFPVSEAEAEALFALIGARLLISVTCSAMNLADEPDNIYLQISDAPAWNLLRKLRDIPPALAHAALRHACGWEPCPANKVFRNWVETNANLVQPIVKEDITNPETVWLDLGVDSPDLGNYADIEDAERLHRRIMEAMNPSGSYAKGRAGIGRYNEVRPFYTTDAYAVQGNDGPEWRTVHIGLDVFLPPETPVYAPLDAVVHSFQDNAADRDYGATIILEHRVAENLTFYTLYGHLTRNSLDGLKRGQKIQAGTAFCRIGPMPENGNWSPHLHFQVMLDILGKEGDYPGVAFPAWRALWTSICPDPWLLLTGRFSPQTENWPAAEISRYRQEHLGKNLSVSYQKPLHILRGWRQYLFDAEGRRYLDTVNNVAHVGHEHPRVVRAGQRQMAVLNTNTRYLHKNIAEFAEELLKTFPPELEVAFLVNSGSEANELAMRLARNYTGSRDLIVVEVGYHGNTQACIEASSYKFDGPGGKGAPDYIHVTPIPDVFRGKYRGNNPETGLKYAGEIGKAVETLRAQGRKPAAFLCESVISCGGQIPLPPAYLAESVRQVRAAGGLYIADEVQTGVGRHGTHFWAFAEHGVTPDIVTVGKPVGNGHPLGVVVTTRAVAEAFANGMEYFNTFGGNPVSCAVGLEVLRVVREEGLQQNALETGLYLRGQLEALARQFPVIGDVRGSGLFLGFELVRDPESLEPAAGQTSWLANRMRELGVLMSTDGPFHNVLKIKPPIVFDRRDADFLTETLERVFKEDFMKI